MPLCTAPSGMFDPTDPRPGRRVGLFSGNKVNVFKQFYPQQDKSPSVIFTIAQFLELFGNIMGIEGQYSGVRIYFANYDGNSQGPVNSDSTNKLTLIFAPTIRVTTSPGNFVDNDDQDKYYYLNTATKKITSLTNPKKVLPTAEDFATQWVKNYQGSIYQALTDDGNNYLNHPTPAFKETKSLFYNYETVFGDGTLEGSDLGLVGYGKCRSINADPGDFLVDTVEFEFAAFLPDDGTAYPSYQMSLIWHFYNSAHEPEGLPIHGERRKKVASFGFPSKPEKHKHPHKHHHHVEHEPAGAHVLTAAKVEAAEPEETLVPFTDPSTGDTGFPCPPYNGCTNATVLNPPS